MSPLEVLQLVGYSIGAVLPLWLAAMLVARRRKLTSLERVLFVLALSIGGWHSSNVVITVHNLFGLSYEQWTPGLRLADTVAVICITFCYSFLLHVHIHLWADAQARPLNRNERIRVYTSYLPTIFLSITIPRIWIGAYQPMLIKLGFFVLPFAFWAAYVLALIAITELMIARRTSNESERRIMHWLAASFVIVGVVVFVSLMPGVGEGTTWGPYLKTLANLGSLLPSALLAYSIYRYRYLELVIQESLIVAAFAAFVLVIYIYGIRTLGGWATHRFGVRAGVVEAILILGLTLGAAPLRKWIEKRFHELFERQATLYREIVNRIGAHGGQYRALPELLRFVEERTAEALALRNVSVVVYGTERYRTASGSERVVFSPLQADHITHPLATVRVSVDDDWLASVIDITEKNNWQPVEEDPILAAHEFRLAYPLRREDRTSGLLLVDGPSGSLTPDTRAVLGVLAGQIAIAIEDCRLVEENVSLERQLAAQERLAVLGQMAATVAHEIKNPLSSIKSIAQVMSEDERVGKEYARDLSLIVGETNRLSQSVTQLLSFARRGTPAELPCRISEVVSSVTELLRPEAEERNITVNCSIEPNEAGELGLIGEHDREIDGASAAALRDSLSNLLLNAVQASPAGGHVMVATKLIDGHATIAVSDDGPGISSEIVERIWEPFFTTKQRGTGLGLAIVRKRMEEAGGSACLASTENDHGARFELRVRVN